MNTATKLLIAQRAVQRDSSGSRKQTLGNEQQQKAKKDETTNLNATVPVTSGPQ